MSRGKLKILNVTYPCPWSHEKDSSIIRCVKGQLSVACAAYTIRELSWVGITGQTASAAARKLKALKIKGLRVNIQNMED